MTIHDELIQRLDDTYDYLDVIDLSEEEKDYFEEDVRWLEDILCRHPPPREPKWWCKCGWAGNDSHHGWELDHTGMAWQPVKGHDLCLCGKMPWDEWR